MVFDFPIVITAGYASGIGHVEKSQHYLNPCRAADLYFKGAVKPASAVKVAIEMGFKGIGLYPNGGRWFMHLDMRKSQPGMIAKWIRDDSGKYHTYTQETFSALMGKIDSAYA